MKSGVRNYKRRPGACEVCKNRKLKSYIRSLTYLPANGSTCNYPPRKKRGRPNKYGYSLLEAAAYEQTKSQGRDSTSIAAGSSTAYEDPRMPSSQAESQRSDQEVIWPSPITFELDALTSSNSAGSLQFDSFGIPDSLLHEDSQEGNTLDLYDASEVMFENVSITPFSVIPSELRSIQDKSELHRRVTELYQDFDVVDFSGATIISRINTFNSAQDLTFEPMEKGIQDVISQINFISSNCRMNDARKEHEDRSSLLQSCLMTFLKHAYMGAKFVDRDTLFRLFDDVVISKTDDAASIALVYAAIANGAKQERVRDSNKSTDPTLAPRYFDMAIKMFEQQLGGKYSITTFKAALTLLIYAVQWAPEEVPRYLTECTAHAQALRLNSRRALSVLCRDSQQEMGLTQGFWLLYIIEKRHSMWTGQFSILPESHIDHILPSQDNSSGIQNIDMITQCLFARLSSHAMQKLHGREARNTLKTGEIDECVRLVRAWKASTITECHITALGKLSTSIQSFELLLCIYAQELLQPAHATRFENALFSILNEAQDVLRLLNDIDNVAMAANWDIVRTTILAFCTSASLLRMVPDRSNLLRYMGSALGYFARVPLTASIPFEKFHRVMAEAFQLSSELREETGCNTGSIIYQR
ncbi:uncharacterized protein M421DRAFT_121288 [Didymella exigua CBS 183.55]|uniref:Xylanolytic transcriptional activator regulatory domain-containing protein n=1 Tax=Didymella exigua CBS 183.55 TaxID=1150837 RepID=A0A6A5S156_9PLEO|nr:uncharacterized protein M421DRAFT_121288 [Didymella exigua CBS 183.55]KAF1934455.1 hypothetical protein M421DRAFT_121288 [Didymella exigua CBS 183.55]